MWVATAVLVGLAFWQFSVQRLSTPTSTGAPGRAVSGSTVATTPPPPPMSPAPRLSGGPPTVWKGEEAFRLYERANNLMDVVAQLESAAKAGDASAQSAYARALGECALLSVDPSYLLNVPAFNRELKANGRTTIPDEVTKRYESRCSQFAASKKITTGEINALERSAESGGEPRAVAADFVRLAPGLKADEKKDELLAILQTGNPYAIGELAELMGRPQDGQGVGKFAGAKEYEYAWRFVACDLGMDCSNNSYLVVRSCLVGMTCGSGDYRAIVQNAELSPAAYQRVLEIERQILFGLKTGDQLESVFFGN